jgi:hypothetical protein
MFFISCITKKEEIGRFCIINDKEALKTMAIERESFNLSVAIII